MGGACSTYGGEERCMQGVLWGNVSERGHSEDIGVDGQLILRWIFRKWDGAWTGLIWLRIGISGELF
jgi:hypothetical protein